MDRAVPVNHFSMIVSGRFAFMIEIHQHRLVASPATYGF